MNADFYRHRDFGILVYDGELCRFNTSHYAKDYSLYNCVDTLFVNSSGDFLYKRLGEKNTADSVRQFIQDNDILFSVAFGPVLVENGRAIPCGWYPVGEVGQGYSRAGIGQIGPLHYLYMSLNHGSHEARWTVTQFAEHFAEKPVRTAYCLDGGQTGEVVFRGEPYNYIDFGVERTVSATSCGLQPTDLLQASKLFREQKLPPLFSARIPADETDETAISPAAGEGDCCCFLDGCL